MFLVMTGYNLNKHIKKPRIIFGNLALPEEDFGMKFSTLKINKKIKILLGLKKVRVLLLCFVL